MRSSAKLGIIALIDEATGFSKRQFEYRELFRDFIRNEVKAWEKEFPDQFFDVIYHLYRLPRKHQYKHPQFFSHFIRRYIYIPLANSHGAILEKLEEKNPVVYVGGGRKYKLFSYLTDEIGLPQLRAHIWQVIGIGNATKTKESFERGFARAFPQPHTQMDMFDDPPLED